MKKCPPGVLCIENLTLGIMIVIFAVIIYLFHVSAGHKPTNIIIEPPNPEIKNAFGIFTRPNYAYTNFPADVLMNPYVPPLRDERYLVPEVFAPPPPGRVPINISTSIGAVDTNYRQVGILTPIKGNNSKILPLLGRPLFVNRDKWQYYTMTDQNNSIKLPIIFKGRNCTNEYGCDKLYGGDVVFVEGYQEAFKVTAYENDTIRYLPFL
jgi:hypothetical protein